MPTEAGSVFKGLLFDFDGTLASTMEDNFYAWQYALHAVGADITKEEYFLLEGMKLSEVARVLCERHGVTLHNYADIARRKEEYYASHNTFALYPGVEDFVNTLKHLNIPMAIVTAGHYDRIIRSTSPQFINCFKAVITGDRVKRNKPFPDPYIQAAQEITVPIQECIVIENAPLGIESAKAAGAFCIAISSTLASELLSNADKVIMRFAELPQEPVIQEIVQRARFMLESSV